MILFPQVGLFLNQEVPPAPLVVPAPVALLL